jgi:hypothetical protein
MSTTIGDVNINLRLSLAQFSKDVKQGTEDARNATQGMASSMRENTQQAKAAMALLGEEIGVTIPRHLRTFISELPGVSTAMSAAFNSVAVLALIELIVKVAEKVQQWREQAQKAAEAWQAADADIIQSTRKLDEQLLQLQARLDELAGDHVGALHRELQLIDLQTFDHLSEQIKKLVKDTDAAFAALDVSGFEKFFGGENAPMQKAKADFDALAERVKTLTQEQATAEIASTRQKVEAWRDLGKAQGENGEIARVQADEIQAATTRELSALSSLATQYTLVEKIGADEKLVKQRETEKRATEELDRATQKLNDTLDKMAASIQAAGPLDITKSAAVQRLEAYGHMLNQGRALTDGINPQMPAYGGTAEAMKMAKIQEDQNAALDEARKIYTQTRTPMEQYREELAMLSELLKQNKIDQDTYNRAVEQAADKLNGTKKMFDDLGNSIGRTINQAILMQTSWTNALKAILIQLAEVIIKMELLQWLDDQGGGGGWMSSFISGLAGGKASGGSVAGGSSYLVGEAGPEIFTPGSSGYITPNGAISGAGVVVNQYVDARGATDPAATELAVRRALTETHKQAVQDAVRYVSEQNRRRR